MDAVVWDKYRILSVQVACRSPAALGEPPDVSLVVPQRSTELMHRVV